MDSSVIADKVKEVALPIFSSMGVSCVEMVYSGPRQGGLLRVFIDKEGGITLDDCQKVSQSLGHALDVADIVPQHYVLEVSSPGMDRKLYCREDFQRFMGRTLKIKTKPPFEGKTRFKGKLTGFQDDKVYLLTSRQKESVIPFEVIAEARLDVDVSENKLQ